MSRGGLVCAALVGVMLASTVVRADPARPAVKPNEVLRAEEGTTTVLPSVAGRPRRRYADRGVLELGGSITLVKATAYTQLGAFPTFGWFFVDYVELSVMPIVEYVKTATAQGRARFSLILEPSFHISLTGPLFVFFGAGVGGAYEKESGGGLAIAPRTGINLMIGGSGVLNLAFSYVYTATRRTAIEDGSTDKHTSTLGIQSGYSVAW